MKTRYDVRIERLAQQAGEGEPAFEGVRVFRDRAEYAAWKQTPEGRAANHDTDSRHGRLGVFTGFNMIIGDSDYQKRQP